MAENSKISWTDHTFNPWIGCTKVSPACAHCYAERDSKRHGWAQWGPGQPRMRTKPANWAKPVQWNGQSGKQKAESRNGEYRRPRVFSASLADWLDDDGVPIEWLADFLALIHATPNLDWLLLTKRPENWHERLAAVGDFARSRKDAALIEFTWTWGRKQIAPANVWMGVTAENQDRADLLIPQLLEIPARVRFVSAEPLLGPMDLTPHTHHSDCSWHSVGVCDCEGGCDNCPPGETWLENIHWVITGGESGPGARPTHPDWVRSLRDQCANAGIAFHHKQWGEWLPICEQPPDWKPEPNGVDWHAGKSSMVLQLSGEHREAFPPGAMTCVHVGKKAAGRTLDGVIHDAFPEAEKQKAESRKEKS